MNTETPKRTYGRKNGGTWHKVSSSADHRAFCNQRVQANQTTTEVPEGRKCAKCFPGAQS